MRVATILLALAGPVLIFMLGGIASTFAILGSPFTLNSPDGYRITALGVAPGLLLSGIAVVMGISASARRRTLLWTVLQALWVLCIAGASIVVARTINSTATPWFFPLFGITLMTLAYSYMRRQAGSGQQAARPSAMPTTRLGALKHNGAPMEKIRGIA